MKIIGAVSPAALPILITVPVRIPGRAAGKIIVTTVFQRLAPNPKAPSLYDRGTAIIASSDDLIMVGRISKDNVRAPANTLFDSDT